MVFLGIPSQEPEVLSVLLHAIMNMPTPPWTAPIIEIYEQWRDAGCEEAQVHLHAALSWAWNNEMGHNPEIVDIWDYMDYEGSENDADEEENYEVITPDYSYTNNEREQDTLDELYSWRNEFD